MLIAGYSEFILILCLLFIATLLPRNSGKAVQTGYLLALSIIASTAFLGGLKFLQMADTQHYHQILGFYSKHLAMPFFVMLALWPCLKSPRPKLIAKIFLSASVVSLLVNLKFKAGVVSDVIIIGALIFTASQVKQSTKAFISVLLGLTLLLSTLLWSILVKDESFRIGIFHLCLSAYFYLIARSLNNVETQKNIHPSHFKTPV